MKRLNDDLINIFISRFKFDRHKSFKTKIHSVRIMFSNFFKMRLTSCDLDSFINFDFLNVRLKCSENDLFEIDSSIENLIKFEKEIRDFDFFVNHDFLNIRLKCSENNLLTIYSIKRTVV